MLNSGSAAIEADRAAQNKAQERRGTARLVDGKPDPGVVGNSQPALATGLVPARGPAQPARRRDSRILTAFQSPVPTYPTYVANHVNRATNANTLS